MDARDEAAVFRFGLLETNAAGNRGGDVRQGYFEEDHRTGQQRVFRLRWKPVDALSDEEKHYAYFIRYLITRGRLNEQVDVERP